MNTHREYRPLDHKRLALRRRNEVARAVSIYTHVEPGLSMVTIMHEADDSCCKREPWPDTMAFILSKVLQP